MDASNIEQSATIVNAMRTVVYMLETGKCDVSVGLAELVSRPGACRTFRWKATSC